MVHNLPYYSSQMLPNMLSNSQQNMLSNSQQSMLSTQQTLLSNSQHILSNSQQSMLSNSQQSMHPNLQPTMHHNSQQSMHPNSQQNMHINSQHNMVPNTSQNMMSQSMLPGSQQTIMATSNYAHQQTNVASMQPYGMVSMTNDKVPTRSTHSQPRGGTNTPSAGSSQVAASAPAPQTPPAKKSNMREPSGLSGSPHSQIPSSSETPSMVISRLYSLEQTIDSQLKAMKFQQSRVIDCLQNRIDLDQLTKTQEEIRKQIRSSVDTLEQINDTHILPSPDAWRLAQLLEALHLDSRRLRIFQEELSQAMSGQVICPWPSLLKIIIFFSDLYEQVNITFFSYHFFAHGTLVL